MLESQPGAAQHLSDIVESHPDLDRGIARHFACLEVTAEHGGNEQQVVGEDARRVGLVESNAWNLNGLLMGEVDHATALIVILIFDLRGATPTTARAGGVLRKCFA